MVSRFKIICMKELRLLVRLKNNRLVERREALGLTLRAMAEVIGVRRDHYQDMETLRRRPVDEEGQWTQDALQVAEYFDCDPRELFPEAVVAVREPVVERRLNGAEVVPLALSAHTERFLLPPDESIAAREESEQLRKIVATLPTREQEVLTKVYGLDNKEPQTISQLTKTDPTQPCRVRLDQLKNNGLSHAGNIIRKIERSSSDPEVIINRARLQQEEREAQKTHPKFKRVIDLLDACPGMLEKIHSVQDLACRYCDTRIIAKINPSSLLKLDLYVILPTTAGAEPREIEDFLANESASFKWTPEVPALVQLRVKLRDYPDDPELPPIITDARAGGFKVVGIDSHDVRLSLSEEDPREEVLQMRLWFGNRAVLKTLRREYAVWCPTETKKTRPKKKHSPTSPPARKKDP